MSPYVTLLILLFISSCDDDFQKIQIRSIEEKNLSRILGRPFTYPVLSGTIENGECLCIWKSKDIEVKRILCDSDCANKIKLDCPFSKIGMAYKDYTPHSDVLRVNEYFYKQPGEKTKHPLIADSVLDYYEKVRNICLIRMTISGNYEVELIK